MGYSVDHNVKLNYQRLEDEVRMKALEKLRPISNDGLKSCIDAAKLVAKSVLESFFFSIEDLYLDGDKKIEDTDLRDKFEDFHDGYRATMVKWVHEHEIQIRQKTFDSSIENPRKQIGKYRRMTVLIVVIWGLLTFVLACFASAWISILFGIFTLLLATLLYFRSRNRAVAEYKQQCEEYEKQVEDKIQCWVNNLISDLKSWLQDAETFSDGLLKSFGV